VIFKIDADVDNFVLSDHEDSAFLPSHLPNLPRTMEIDVFPIGINL
jgi:hypothetical protein